MYRAHLASSYFRPSQLNSFHFIRLKQAPANSQISAQTTYGAAKSTPGAALWTHSSGNKQLTSRDLRPHTIGGWPDVNVGGEKVLIQQLVPARTGGACAAFLGT